MLKNNLKRVAPVCHQYQPVNEETRLRLKHQGLLQDYLELQKDFVSKRKKLQIAEQKRDLLLEEVRFLRQRHRYLMKIQSDNLYMEEDLVLPQNSTMQGNVVVEPLRIEKKLKKFKNHLINGKNLPKKKISWQDKVASKVLMP